MAAVPPTDPTIRRRRSSSSSGRARKTRRFDPALADRVMIVLAGLFALVTAFQLNSRLGFYPDISLDWDAGELVYGFGEPQRKQALGGGAERWIYDREGSRVTATLVDGRVRETSCRVTAVNGQCDEKLGIAANMTERDLWLELGEPTRTTVRDGVKIAAYPELGLTYELSRFRVTGVMLRKRGLSLPFIARYFRVMLP